MAIRPVSYDITGLPQTWNTQDFSETENSGNSVQPQGKIVTNKVFLVCHSNICVKQLLTYHVVGVDVEWPWWRLLLHLLFVAITYGKVSLWLWKSLENSDFFSPTLWLPCITSFHSVQVWSSWFWKMWKNYEWKSSRCEVSEGASWGRKTGRAEKSTCWAYKSSCVNLPDWKVNGLVRPLHRSGCFYVKLWSRNLYS